MRVSPADQPLDLLDLSILAELRILEVTQCHLFEHFPDFSWTILQATSDATAIEVIKIKCTSNWPFSMHTEFFSGPIAEEYWRKGDAILTGRLYPALKEVHLILIISNWCSTMLPNPKKCFPSLSCGQTALLTTRIERSV